MSRLLLALVLVALSATPAGAFDPNAERTRAGPPDPHDQAAREGLYQVADVYVRNEVTRSGEVTTYSTLTEHRVIDTYARPVGTVRTGEASPFDGAAFNGRTALSTGELVAGTYYEDYVWTGDRFVRANIVFFQDDTELARRRDRESLPVVPREVPGPEPGGRTDPPPAPSGPGREPPDHDAATPTTLEVGLDPTGGPALRDTLEVSRGARYAFAVNVRGTPAVVLEAWQLVDGTNNAWNAPGWHAASDRLIGNWLRLPLPDASWTLTLRVRVHRLSGGPTLETEKDVRIFVRSPAVVE